MTLLILIRSGGLRAVAGGIQEVTDDGIKCQHPNLKCFAEPMFVVHQKHSNNFLTSLN